MTALPVITGSLLISSLWLALKVRRCQRQVRESATEIEQLRSRLKSADDQVSFFEKALRDAVHQRQSAHTLN